MLLAGCPGQKHVVSAETNGRLRRGERRAPQAYVLVSGRARSGVTGDKGVWCGLG